MPLLMQESSMERREPVAGESPLVEPLSGLQSVSFAGLLAYFLF